jgi:hypothetical protein
MINHEHKYIFIHVPKTAGTSIVKALDLPDKGHYTQLEIYKRYEGAHDISKYFSFGFVKNPWARFLSLYFYLIRTSKKTSLTFSEYAKRFKSERPILSLNTKEFKKSGVSLRHYLPQFNFFLIDDINYIGKTENIQHCFDIVCDKIGIPHQQLPHKNATTHKHYTEYYDDETKEIVAKKYAKDIEYFGYEFGD